MGKDCLSLSTRTLDRWSIERNQEIEKRRSSKPMIIDKLHASCQSSE